jgi:predicted RNase H-like HicB family nuclease
MRKIYLLLFLLVYGFSFGQANLTGKAHYVLESSLNIGGAHSSGYCGSGGLRWFYLSTKNGPIYLKSDDGSDWENKYLPFKLIEFDESNPITGFSLYSRYRAASWGKCYTESELTTSKTIKRNENVMYLTNSVFASGIGGAIIMNTYPVIDLKNSQTANNILGTDSPLKISAIDGVAPEFFQWAYYILGDDIPYTVYIPDPDCNPWDTDQNGDLIQVDCSEIPETRYKPNWRSLIHHQGINSLTIAKCSDILPLEALGKQIILRANSNEKGSNLTFNYNNSAPHIVSIEKIETSCSTANDGKVKINFSRPLELGETLSLDFGGVNTIDVSNITRDGIYEGKKFDSDNSYTVGNLNPGLTTLNLLGYYEKDGYKANTYVMDPDHQTSFTINPPVPVNFSVTSKTNILCSGVDDGVIEITATGGIDNGIYQYSTNYDSSWKSFTNGNRHSISGLPQGSCSIKVRKIKNANDTVGCMAKFPNTEKDLVVTEPISKPSKPLTINYTHTSHPTFKGAANGKIVAAITGGTIKDDKTYSYAWKNSSGTPLKAIGKYNAGDETYNITLDSVPDGTYKLTVYDKNHTAAVNKAGCSIIESPQTLTEPKAIKITLKETQAISCNTDSVDPDTGDSDKLSDGILTATVEGGIPYAVNENNGMPYRYFWSKYNDASQEWELLKDIKGAVATGLSKGKYALNVLDKKDITQGEYNTIELIEAVPTPITVTEPHALQLTFDFGNVSCHAGNNGWATAKVSGGTPNLDGSYSYQWYNVGGGIINKDQLTALTLGTYSVTVTDGKGCTTQGAVIIDEPRTAITLNYKDIIHPTFSGATNGKIIAEITGGTPNTDGSYSSEWKNKKGEPQVTTTAIINGIYTITLDGVPEDDYFLTVWDKNYNLATNQIVNCSVINSKTPLIEPDPLVVAFEIKQTISCNVSNEFGEDKDTAPSDGQRDESQDGILIAHVKGGTPLAASTNNGLPYYFYWKKQQADGTWITWNENDETAENLSHGNYALNVKDRNGIMLGTYVNNTLVRPINVTQFMQEPAKLAVTFTKGDVFCNQGNDGWATANVTGGTPPYQYEWSNGETVSENTILSAGTYLVKIVDVRGCTTQGSVEIKQAIKPITLDYTQVSNPSFYKATNGKIVVDVKGGTIFPDHTYWYEWKNSKGITQTTTTAQFNNGIFTITLNGLPDDTYTLTVRDANYNPATNKTGCTIINSSTTLKQPDPLVVRFEIQRTISCNVTNTFGNESDVNPADGRRDESQDGVLIAHVTGGIALSTDKNNGLPYFYTWKKQLADGSWVIWNDQDGTAETISHGTYALNIEDANGIKLGTYVNNILTKEIDVTQFMPEPPQLSLTFTKLDVGCTTGNDGWAAAHVTGGTAPYTYQWTNEATTARINNLTANNYFVIVTDAKGCTIQGSIFVGDPKGVFTTETIKNPTCFQGNDGSINLDVTGGNLPYQYLWNTGATTKDISNLAAGNYEVSINCPDCCVYKKNFILKDPEPIVINLGSDRTLCNEQSLELDASILDLNAQYSWTSTNGFKSNSAKVNVTKSGIYHVKVTSALGCIGEDSIEIKTNKVAISSEFLLSSQAYLDEEVILVNTSEPFGENTQWMIPNGVAIVDQKEKFITLKFNTIGSYAIGLKQTQGDCYAVYSKNIMVEQRSTLPNTDAENSKFITDFIITPNPSDGNFKAIINLEDNSPVSLRLFSYNGQYSLVQKKESGKKNYSVDFDANLATGMYVLVLETAQQTLVKKIIIY